MRKITSVMLLAALVLVCMTSCKKERSLYENDGSDIIPVVNPEGRVEMLNLRTGVLTNFGKKDVVRASMLHEGLMVLKVQESDGIRYYYADEEGKIVLGPYASASIFSEGKAWVSKEKEHLQAIDHQGNKLFELDQAQTAEAYVNGTALFWTVGGELGLVDDKGNVIIEPSSNAFVCRMGKRMIAGTDSVWTLVRNGQKNWSDGTVFGIRGRDMAAVDSNDLERRRAADNFVNSSREYVRFAGREQDVRANLQLLVDINHRLQQMIEEGRIIAGRDGQWGVVDTTGRWIVEPEYDEVIPDEGMYMVVRDNLIGWIGLDGRQTIDCRFVKAEPFDGRREIIATCPDGKEVLLNRHGQIRPVREAVPAQMGWKIPGKRRYMYADDMGIALRRMNPGSWIITKEGYNISDDMLMDFLASTDFRKAASDYLDINNVVEGLKIMAQGRNSITARELIDNYPEQHYTGDHLMRLNGGEAMLEWTHVSDTLYITTFAEDIHCTTQVYTGWMERLYDTVFYGSARIGKFRFEVLTGGKLRDRFDELQKAVKESGDWSAKGKKITVKCDAKARKIVINVRQ